MNPRIGDRFEYHRKDVTGYIIEVTGEDTTIILEGNERGAVYDVKGWNFKSPSEWKYLGNFSKDSNFEQLYNLFNS